MSVNRPALLDAAVAALALFHLGVLAYHLAMTLGFPYELNYGEGYVLNDAVRLAHGQGIYVDLQQFPMVRSPYTPLFALAWSALVPVFGPVLWPGRAIEVASLLAVCGLVAINAWRVRAGVGPVLASLALVVASPFVYQWAGYARVDLLALALAVGGVVAAQWLDGRRGVLLAALLCGLALWTKQTTLTASAAVAIALGLQSWRRGLVFVALIGIPTLAAGWLLNAASDGEFARHVVLGNASNPVVPLKALIYVGTFATLNLIALAAGVWWLRHALVRRPAPVAVYLPIALVAAFSTASGGSSINYLIEPVLALALAVPFVWRALPRAEAAAAPLFTILQLLLLVHWPNAFGTTYLADSAIGRTPTAEDAVVGARVNDLIRQAPGAVIAEAASFALGNGLPVYLQPIDLRAEQVHGRWQPGPLVQALSDGRFSTVVVAYDLFPAEAVTAIEEHFTLADTLPSPDGVIYRVYAYRG